MNKNTRQKIKIWRKWIKKETGKHPQRQPRKSTKAKVGRPKKD